MTPKDLLEAEWDEVPIPIIADPEELLVWITSSDDPSKRTLRCIQDMITHAVFVIVYDQHEQPTQSWRVRWVN